MTSTAQVLDDDRGDHDEVSESANAGRDAQNADVERRDYRTATTQRPHFIGRRLCAIHLNQPC